ncbi:hypothetical protein FA13DRAFT_1393864 [Coprinellus micaceus]|uniref:Uncharacterized protein n=1 Tax=Coprinellus micaceus TaxID=71717 RepID=A0A4Y7SQA5_COPMI|nr:hypothetical protein FA13DRAFT_1393864 [Coprinellus micaceus]
MFSCLSGTWVLLELELITAQWRKLIFRSMHGISSVFSLVRSDPCPRKKGTLGPGAFLGRKGGRRAGTRRDVTCWAVLKGAGAGRRVSGKGNGREMTWEWPRLSVGLLSDRTGAESRQKISFLVLSSPPPLPLRLDGRPPLQAPLPALSSV